MGAFVIGVVRSASRLDALTIETREAEDRAFPWKVDYACELRPLAASSRAELWTAWRALESVTSWDETTLDHVLTVLRTTVPCADTPPDLPALGPEVHAAPEPRATAAHPCSPSLAVIRSAIPLVEPYAVAYPTRTVTVKPPASRPR